MKKKPEPPPAIDRISEGAPWLPDQQESGIGGNNGSVPAGPRTIESLRASLRINTEITSPFEVWETT